jgi:hypothetical protein
MCTNELRSVDEQLTTENRDIVLCVKQENNIQWEIRWQQVQRNINAAAESRVQNKLYVSTQQSIEADKLQSALE